jgi:predicted secreted protein
MIAAYIILTSLIALLPALVMIDGMLANGVASAIVAIAMVAVVLTLHTSDLNRFSRLLRPTAFIVLFIPCLWMLLQVLPIPTRSLANPVWVSASTALNKPFVGAISMDISATLLSLTRYCAILAAAFVTATVALDKQRAGSVLSLLTGIAALIAAELIAYDLGYLRLPGYEHLGERADAMNIAVIGFILSGATTIRAYEHLDSTQHRKSGMMAIAAASASMAALFIFLSAILIGADPVLFLAALFGTGIVISVLAIRRWRLGPLGQAGIAALAAVAVFGFFAVVPAKNGVDLTLALSTQGQTSSIERMLSDAKWAGSGAGSFEALLPIYRDSDEADSPQIPTAAATIAIEMGRPFLWTCVIAALIGASTLFRRALLRGRDYVYSSAGAGCIVALLISLFANDGILGLTASLMISVVCGLAFAQSKSASNRNLDLSEELYSTPNTTRRRTGFLDES